MGLKVTSYHSQTQRQRLRPFATVMLSMMLPFSCSPQQNSPATAEVQDVLNAENAGALFRSTPAKPHPCGKQILHNAMDGV